jgi:hypothetical protein
MEKLVSSQRARLAPDIEQISGTEMREDFRGAFENAAGRFALGRIDAGEFRAVVGELIRDASGTAYQQDRAAERAAALPDPDARAPWATMPTDGSGTLTVPERVVYGVIGAACLFVLVMIAWTTGMIGGSSPDAPRTPSQVVSDADMITQGGYWSWAVADGCARGPAECDAVLRDVNGAAQHYGVRVWEDGTISPVGRSY